jgi:hypothetical protein
LACRMPQNAPEAAHYRLQLVALKREVDKGKGNSMLYSAYLQVHHQSVLLIPLPLRYLASNCPSDAKYCISTLYVPLRSNCDHLPRRIRRC